MSQNKTYLTLLYMDSIHALVVELKMSVKI